MICRKCGVEKLPSEYHVRRDTGRLRSECKTCRGEARAAWMSKHPEVHRRAKQAFYERYKPQQRERSREWARNNPQKRFATHLKRTFGITAEQYADMLRVQENVCAICQLPEDAVDKRNGRTRRLHVDHNHATGLVRGLLCTRCNMAVGYLRDSPELAQALALYLNHHGTAGRDRSDRDWKRRIGK